MNSKLKEVIDQVPPNYYFQGIKTNLFQKYWHQKKWAVLKKFLSGSSGKLLDIGCADGTTTNFIKENFKGLQVSGVDYYDKAIDFAKKKYPGIKFIVGDAHNLPFQKSSFDLVITIETLEHLENPDKVLAEINRVLKQGGYLIIGQDTNNILFKAIWWLWTKGKGSVWVNSHINCMKPVQLIKKIKSKGLRIIQKEYVHSGMEIFIKAQKIR